MNVFCTPDIVSGLLLMGSSNVSKTSAEVQLRTRPSIDDVICHYLDGGKLNEALSFIDHARASKMKIRWSSVNVWSVKYKRKHVCDIVLRHNSWSVRSFADTPETSEDYDLYDPESVKRLMEAYA